MQRIPTLIGVAGHFAGEVFPLRYGRTLTVGRSRSADFSLKRTERYRSQTQEQRENDEAAQTVSAKHFQITLYNLRSVEIKNLSPNGITVDGKPVDQTVLNDVATQPHEIRFGLEEAVRLEMQARADS
jgi:pSer/pThr/pTyr-binding forkhead associated (FHA) protein